MSKSVFRWSSIWEGLVTNALFGAVLLGGGVVLGGLRAISPEWFAVVLWGLVGVALVSVPLATVALIRQASQDGS